MFFKQIALDKLVDKNWMFLIISFWLFVDLYLNFKFERSILEIDYTWVKSNINWLEGVYIAVSYSFFVSGVLPAGVHLIKEYGLYFLRRLNVIDGHYKKISTFAVNANEVELESIRTNNLPQYYSYVESLNEKNAFDKHISVCRSILAILCLGLFVGQFEFGFVTMVYGYVSGESTEYLRLGVFLISFVSICYILIISFNSLSEGHLMPKQYANETSE